MQYGGGVGGEGAAIEVESNYKLIQYSSLAIGTILAILTFFKDQPLPEYSQFLLIPLFLFTAALASAVSNIMHILYKGSKPDWLFNLINKLHNNILFKSWYLFLCAVVALEIIFLIIILKNFHVIS
jgi:hypothetical protein